MIAIGTMGSSIYMDMDWEQVVHGCFLFFAHGSTK